MATHSDQHAPWFRTPQVAAGMLRFAIMGDGQNGNAGPAPPEVARTTKGTPFYKVRSLSVNLQNKRFVAGTEQAGSQFIYSDDYGSNWSIGQLSSAFNGVCSRIFYAEGRDLFVGLSRPLTSHSLVTSADGINWSPIFQTVAQKVHSGFAFSPSRIVVVQQLSGNNVLMFDGVWHIGTTGDDGGYSVVWLPDSSRFLGFRPGSQIIRESVNGLDWSDYFHSLPVPVGTPAGTFNAYVVPLADNSSRILLFTEGGTEPAWYSDDLGENWSPVSGLQPTGSDTRYVAVDSNAVYVAYNAELNFGMISLDYGETWERADHFSGNASSVIALS